MAHTPRKRFGQNFLRDREVIGRIVAAIAPAPADHLVEIGPGEGALTSSLLPACGRLDAVEIDRDLAAHLQTRFGADAKWHLHQADALQFDFAQLTQEQPLRIVGNLPYNISTPLLFHLFSHSRLIRDMHFMLQKEVVDRLTAAPDEPDYGRLGIMAQYHCRAIKLFEVFPESFFPAPKVVSAIVRLIPHEQPPVTAQPEDLARVVAAAFSQRRKTLRNSLRILLDEAEINAAQIDPGVRAETLGLAEFARLAECLRKKNQPIAG